MLDPRQDSSKSKLDELKFKPECLSEDVLLYSDAIKVMEELESRLTFSIIDELNRAVNAYTEGIQSLQEVFKEES
jgi:hypothetical protein